VCVCVCACVRVMQQVVAVPMQTFEKVS